MFRILIEHEMELGKMLNDMEKLLREKSKKKINNRKAKVKRNSRN